MSGTMEVGNRYVCCCYLDILGYKNMAKDFYKNIDKKTLNQIGEYLSNNSLFIKLDNALSSSSSSLDSLVEKYKKLSYDKNLYNIDDIKKTISMEVISDTIFIKMNLDINDDKTKKSLQLLCFHFLIFLINKTLLTNCNTNKYGKDCKKVEVKNKFNITVRGGIYCGSYVESPIKDNLVKGNIVVSEALINSYLLESKVAKECRIVVSSTFFDYFKDVITDDVANFFIKDNNDKDFFTILNTTNDGFNNSISDELEKSYSFLKEQNKDNSYVCEKYQYMLDLISFNKHENKNTKKTVKKYGKKHKIKSNKNEKFEKVTVQDLKNIATKVDDEKKYLATLPKEDKKKCPKCAEVII